MEINITKLSQESHSLSVRRKDLSEESVALNIRSFLRHDLALETELPIPLGFWSSAAHGTPLHGLSIKSPDIALAESLAGPIQTLMRVDANEDTYFQTLHRIQPKHITPDITSRIRARGKQLLRHWKATNRGQTMQILWSET